MREGSQGKNLDTESESGHRGICTGLLSYHFNTNQNHHFRGNTAHSGLGLTTSTIDEENAPQSCLQANKTDTVPQLAFHLPNESSLGQVDKKETNTNNYNITAMQIGYPSSSTNSRIGTIWPYIPNKYLKTTFFFVFFPCYYLLTSPLKLDSVICP